MPQTVRGRSHKCFPSTLKRFPKSPLPINAARDVPSPSGFALVELNQNLGDVLAPEIAEPERVSLGRRGAGLKGWHSQRP